MFRTAESTFRNGERTFRSAEYKFTIAEHKTNKCIISFYLRLSLTYYLL